MERFSFFASVTSLRLNFGETRRFNVTLFCIFPLDQIDCDATEPKWGRQEAVYYAYLNLTCNACSVTIALQ